MAATTVDVRNYKGDPNNPGVNPNTGKELEWNSVPSAGNPYWHSYQNHNEDHRDRFLGRTSVQINIHPKVFIKGTAAIDFMNFKELTYVPSLNANWPLGFLNSAKEYSNKANFQAIANYSDRFLSEDIGLNLMVGAYSERDKFVRNTANGTEWVIPNYYSITNLKNREIVNETVQDRGTNSIFGEANVDWRSIVFLTFTGRKDWFSVLNPNSNSVFYPSVGGSVIVSQLVNLPDFFNFAKIRASWAQVGQATVNVGQINQMFTISTNNAYGLPTLNNPNSLLNPDLQPVTSTTTEVGFQVNFFDSRLGLDVNHYDKKSTNNILSPPISGNTGYTSGPMNLGIISNKGWEISLTGTPIIKRNFSWDVAFNFSYNKSKIIELAEGIEYLRLGQGYSGSGTSVLMINAPGLPYSTIRGYRMKRDENGTLVYNARTGYEVREEVDLGTGVPPALLGLNNNFRYKNFTLTVDIDSKYGGQCFSNHIQYAARFGLIPETLPGRENGLTVTGIDQNGNPYSYLWPLEMISTYYNAWGNDYSAQFVYKTDFVKLRRMALRYDLPSKYTRPLKLERVSVAITGQNLLILYQDKAVKHAGIDPEMQATTDNAQGSQGVNMPSTRNFGFNVNIRF